MKKKENKGQRGPSGTPWWDLLNDESQSERSGGYKSTMNHQPAHLSERRKNKHDEVTGRWSTNHKVYLVFLIKPIHLGMPSDAGSAI